MKVTGTFVCVSNIETNIYCKRINESTSDCFFETLFKLHHYAIEGEKRLRDSNLILKNRIAMFKYRRATHWAVGSNDSLVFYLFILTIDLCDTITDILKKLIEFMGCLRNHEYFGSLAKLCKIPEVFMIPRTFQYLNLLLIFTFNYEYLKYKNYFNLGIKTVLYLK